MGVERKQGDDLKHLGTVVGEKKKILLPLILNLEFKIVGVFLQMQLKGSKIILNIKLCLGHWMGGYPIFCLMRMFNCTRTSTNCVFILITDQVLKTHKERLFFNLSKNIADTLHDPSGATALFVLFTWHSLIGKGRGVKISKKTRNPFLTISPEKEISLLLFLLLLLN